MCGETCPRRRRGVPRLRRECDGEANVPRGRGPRLVSHRWCAIRTGTVAVPPSTPRRAWAPVRALPSAQGDGRLNAPCGGLRAPQVPDNGGGSTRRHLLPTARRPRPGCASPQRNVATVAVASTHPSDRNEDALCACTDAQTLLTAVRDSMQLNFGDHGLGQEYGSLQGAPRAHTSLASSARSLHHFNPTSGQSEPAGP